MIRFIRNNMVAIPPEINQIRDILTWIGFTTIAERNEITSDAFTTFDDILSLKEKDIKEFSEAFGRRSATNERINFDIRRTKKLKSILHWFQCFKFILSTPTINGLI